MLTYVIHPYLKHEKSRRSPEARLEEAVRLSSAISLELIGSSLIPLNQYRPATLIGQGKADELAALIKEKEVGLVIADCALSPAQQRNLEKILKCKVIDRTALILEIFGARARTHEGKLQVELAALEYQKSRLVRSWTHLERQRGGFGFLGGPGESQIEIDRRLIRDRITKIKRELETVTRTRELHRKTRRDVPYPLVALVGYTNAGKSTLFNRLTGAKVMAMDKLFATLDPTIRQIKLPSGLEIMLSDTVGFISDLPHELVAAFRATLEEVQEADLLLHVRDISHPDTLEQKEDVLHVINGLFDNDPIRTSTARTSDQAGVKPTRRQEPKAMSEIIEVWNKIDRMENPPGGNAIAVSALTGAGIEGLLAALDERLSITRSATYEVTLSASEGKLIAWLYSHGSVVSQMENEDELTFTVKLSPENKARFEKLMKA